jgi:SHS2 domain-containing protein
MADERSYVDRPHPKDGGASAVSEERGFSYFPHDADVGIAATGKTLEDAFVQAARATFTLMTDLDDVRPLARAEIAFDEEDSELALATWINELLSEAKVKGLVFGRFGLSRSGSAWKGEAWGEPWTDALSRGVEVKGATLTALSVAREPDGFSVRLVVDV